MEKLGRPMPVAAPLPVGPAGRGRQATKPAWMAIGGGGGGGGGGRRADPSAARVRCNPGLKPKDTTPQAFCVSLV